MITGTLMFDIDFEPVQNEAELDELQAKIKAAIKLVAGVDTVECVDTDIEESSDED
jgi:hypothetical protein